MNDAEINFLAVDTDGYESSGRNITNGYKQVQIGFPLGSAEFDQNMLADREGGTTDTPKEALAGKGQWQLVLMVSCPTSKSQKTLCF